LAAALRLVHRRLGGLLRHLALDCAAAGWAAIYREAPADTAHSVAHRAQAEAPRARRVMKADAIVSNADAYTAGIDHDVHVDLGCLRMPHRIRMRLLCDSIDMIPGFGVNRHGAVLIDTQAD
jgi:hypothetical protein